MKVIADSNIFIDFWKHPTQRLFDMFSDGHLDIVSCGPVRSELLHGSYSDKNFREINEAMDSFAEYNVPDNEWGNVGLLLYNLRSNGITVPYVDALIAYIACRNDLQVWTKDRHFRLIKLALPELKLFDADAWTIEN